ncbi:MAG: 3-isopropylmalate dehydratase small subunit [Candidatus Caenarcaniphilales bacterium]|nr:3-isopropylmalate dehydratase small subunit [Candidatus Caenarcaniphilales bacterium]
MALAKIESVKGKAVWIEGNDIDTDRIIPARFMKCLTFGGLGTYAFYDVRFDQEGKSKDHPLDRPEHQGASILISGANFGSGSSREHAPQALYHFGFRGMIAESFAEIFFGNSTTLGIPCVSVSKDSLKELIKLIGQNPALEIKIDLLTKKVLADQESFDFEMPEDACQNLIQGKWDPLGELLEAKQEVKKLANALPYISQ